MKYYIENPQLFEIIKQYNILSYEIKNIILTPQHSAVVQVCFFDECSTYDRSFLLIGDDYLNWTTDEYLYEYINSHFMQIFDK